MSTSTTPTPPPAPPPGLTDLKYADIARHAIDGALEVLAEDNVTLVDILRDHVSHLPTPERAEARVRLAEEIRRQAYLATLMLDVEIVTYVRCPSIAEVDNSRCVWPDDDPEFAHPTYEHPVNEEPRLRHEDIAGDIW